tara:strand:+ start:170 stop:592 length:423 start_codon:yes stop_codon:yes gene_type:complete
MHDSKPKQAPSIAELAVAAEGLTTLVAALKAADLVGALSGEGPFTVLAPTDDAFNDLPEGTLEGLLADTEKLKTVLLSHVIDGAVLADTVVTLNSATTLSGQTLAISTANGVEIGGAGVLKTDIMASNGVIHLIDKVITP